MNQDKGAIMELLKKTVISSTFNNWRRGINFDAICTMQYYNIEKNKLQLHA